ncbi:MAG: YjfB family protein [Selenomonadaceae bacterium]|nr:YjfB family protein [Selenomonadaceae bacterium]MBQ1915396.1 YjfB family protein [Selenomonadaceae bacterium]MBQ3970924.1 YjfB family protein [Selenomonadaceae bacterium]
MGDMTIAAMSVAMHQSQVQQDLGISVMKMAMDTETAALGELMEDMAVSLDPNLGAAVDIMA